MTSDTQLIEHAIINGKEEVFNKRQEEMGPIITQIVNKYMQMVFDNKDLFDNYHNSFYKNESISKIEDPIKYFSDEINKLELNEYDLDLVIDGNSKMTLLDFILKYKPHLSLNNFSIGGSYPELGKKILTKILTSGDKEYIKYLHEIGFYGSPQLFLTTINGKKVIDYLIEDYKEQYHNFCDISFNLVIKDFETKKYILESLREGKYKIINSDDSINREKLFLILDAMDFSPEELIKPITIGNIKTSIIELYLNKNNLKDKEKLVNIILPYNILNSLINKATNTKDEILKQEIIDFLNNSYIDKTTISKLDYEHLELLKYLGISLRIKDNINVDKDFQSKLSKLANILKTGTKTKKEIIEYVINNYNNMYNLNTKFALKEVETLILIKKNHPKFHIEDSGKGPNFDNDTINLTLTDKKSLGYHGEDNYASFNHEMTHALQYYCYDDNTPSKFYSTLPSKIKVAHNVAEYCEKVIDQMDKEMTPIESQKPYLSEEDFNEKRIRLIYYISTNKYGYEREVVDIFDSFLCFTEHLSKLGFDKADYIEGHPYDYMKYGGYDFAELLADYKSVMCSGRDDLIGFVKTNLQEECVSFVENFYMKMLDDYISLYTNDIYKNDFEIDSLEENTHITL